MKTLIKIAWRNVWRNKARSIVIILSVGFGLWGGIFATAFISGLINQQFISGIENQVSHIQIHNPDFIRERQSDMHLADAASIKSFLMENDKVKSFSGRTLSSGMLANASMTSGVEIIGISPEHEMQTIKLHDKVVEGSFLNSDIRNPVMIGAKLAEKMKIQVGNRIVLTFQDIDNNINSASFRVGGIYRTTNSVNDERIVYVLQGDLAKYLGAEGLINEIAILLYDLDMVDDFREVLRSKYPDNEIRTWVEISPDLGFMKEFTGFGKLILLIIIMFALAFGLLNTMLMTIFERTRELGVLMSVGMSKLKVFSMILIETTVLIVTGSLFGSLIGSLTVSLTKKTGIDLTGLGGDALLQYGFDPVIYPELEGAFYINLAVLVLLTAIAASLYPAYKALKLNPADAVRKE